MTLTLESRAESNLPIEVEWILPLRLRGMSEKQIAGEKIWWGRNSVELGELFRVTGTVDDDSIVWQGNLNPVHWIGAGLDGGTMRIESDAGRHVGSKMSAGSIAVDGSVSDFVGAEMTGGTILVKGNAGDLVGGNYPGSKFGMNRGTILVHGDAGRGVGQSMRRGTIAIGGDCGRLCGWNMRAGSIFVFGQCGPEYGAGMIRGTIVLANELNHRPLPTFATGGRHEGALFPLMENWLKQLDFPAASQLSGQSFQLLHGDLLNGGRGEVFVV